MNKLVSRNPVLRFKEGKKIIFAETGIKTSAPTRGTKFGDWMRKQTSKGFVWLNSKDNSIIQPGLEILVDGLYLKGNGTYTSASLRNKKNENVTGTSSKTNNFDKTRQSVNNYADKLLKSSTAKVSTPTDNYYLKGFENRKDEIAKLGGVRAVLKMLGFTAGNGLDGKWGQNTENAYLKYLIANAAKTPSLEDTISAAQNLPILSTPTINPSEYTFTESQLFGLGENPYYEPHSELRFNNFDRTQTRQWLRDNGFNPYSLTGALRKSLRMILNGQGTDEDKNLIGLTNGLSEILTNYKYLKQGGTMNILPSRNIVERFKLGRKLLFAKPGDKMLYNGKEQVTEEVLNGQTIYRRKNGTYVYENNKNLSPLKSTPKTSPKPKATPKVDLGSTEVNRFAIASRKGTRYFDSAEKAKAYLKNLPSGSSVFRDMGEEWKGLVVKADRTQGKDAVSTSYGRKQAEKYNNLSYKDAYKAAQSSGNKYFAYKGKVYKTDLKNGKDNMTEMQGLYGTHLGWSKDPKLQNTLSRAARELYRKDTKAVNTNRNANYNGKTNKLVSAEADKKVALTWNEKQFMDLMLPTPANMINYGIDIVTGNIPNKPHVSGLNIPGLFTDAVEGNYKDAGYRALDLGLSFAPGARVNMTPGGTNVTKGATLLPDGTRTFSKWQLNSLGKNATRPMEGVLRSPKGTLYYIDNGQFTKDITAPLLISNVPVQRTYDLEK